MVRSRGVDKQAAAEIAVRQGEGCPWGSRDGEIWFQPQARFRDKLLLAVLQAGGEILAVQAGEETR
ncbi:hypothetical protein D3C76_1701460 [compost metagenome]